MDKHNFSLRVVPPCISYARECQYMDMLYDGIEEALHKRKDNEPIVKIGKRVYDFDEMTATYYRNEIRTCILK